MHQPVVLVGYGATGYGRTGEDGLIPADGPVKRAGLNRYEGIRQQTMLLDDFDSGFVQHNALLTSAGQPDLGFGPDEVMSASGDSGGPGFVHGVIAGVMASGERFWQTDSNGVLDSSWGELGRDTRVSAFRTFIAEATAGTALFLDRLGDFNFDGQLGVDDIDMLAARIRAGEPLALYDLDHNGTLDADDHRLWVTSLKGTWYGDANLDGEFTDHDLMWVLAAGEYEDGVPGNSTWQDGDWDGDADFISDDLIIALADGGYGRGARRSVMVVPESSGWMGIAIGMMMVCGFGNSWR